MTPAPTPPFPRCLEEAILNFAGTTLVISHDRWFLDRVATHILAFEGDSKVGILAAGVLQRGKGAVVEAPCMSGPALTWH